MIRNSVFLLGTCLSLSVSTTPAQSQDPRAVVDEFLRLTKSERWLQAAALIDSATFAQSLRSRIRRANVERPQTPITVEQMMARDSTMPRAVAEWYVAKNREHAVQQPGDMSHEFFGVTSAQALQALTPLEAAARWLEARDPRAAMKRVIAASNCDAASLRDSTEMFRQFELETIGVANIDDWTSYVLLRPVSDARRNRSYVNPQPTLLELRRTASGWRIISTAMDTAGWSFGFSVNCARVR